MGTTSKTTNLKYIIASILMLLFVLFDLVFDFLFDFSSSDYISFVFTLLASVITFISTYQLRKLEVKNEADNITKFIKSNFNHWQVVFSILDIICGFISLIAGLIVLGGIFKLVKIVYIPIKCLTVTNKSKTVVKSITKFSLVWTTSRLFSKKGEKKMLTWIKNNKLTLAYCIVIGLLAAFCGYVLPLKFFGTPVWANILIAIASFVVADVLIVLLGGDKVKQAIFRAASYTLSDENYDKVTSQIEALLEEQELTAIAESELEEEAKTAEQTATSEEEAEKRAKIDAIKEQLKAKNVEE